MLDKKQIQAIVLFMFKMGRKAVETTCNVNNAFGPGTTNKHTGPWWFKKFYKGDRSPEDEECSGRPVAADNQEPSWSCERTQRWPFYGHLVLKQIGKVKKLRKWLPHELTKKF